MALEPEPAAESAPESEPESVSESAPDVGEPEGVAGTAPPAEPPPAPESEPRPEETEAASEPAPEAAEPESEPEAEPESEPEAEPDSQPPTKPEPEPQPPTEPEPGPGDGESTLEDEGSRTTVGGDYTVTVDGVTYLLPSIPGTSDHSQTQAWIYDFATGTYESVGHLPKAFDPSIRRASEDYEFAWISDPASIFADYLEESVRSTAAASGIRIGVVCESEFDPQGPPTCAEAVVETHPDAVIISTWSWHWMKSEVAMEIFDNARIPVVFPNVWHPNAILFSTNDYTAGAIAGVRAGLYASGTWGCEDVHALLQKPIDLEGEFVVNLGFVDGVEAVCGDLPVSHIAASDPWGTLDETDAWLTANPGAGHVLAFTDNSRAVSMSHAMENAGRSGLATGHGLGVGFPGRLFEGSPEETRYLGSVVEFPEIYGVYAVAALIDILDGRAVPREIHMDRRWIDRHNVGEHYDPVGRPIHNLGPALAGRTPEPAGGPSDAPDDPFTLTVNGTEYAMPGPAGGILGALPPDAVFPWTYNFDTATFEAGDSPAATFDPSTRTATRDYEIAWVSGWADLEFSQYVRDSIERTAAASGVHVGAICDSRFDPEKALACAETVAQSDPDAVIFSNWRSEAAESSMEVFDEAGIPVVTIDLWHPNAIFFGADNYVSGAIAGINSGLYALEAWNCEDARVLLARNPAAGEVPNLRTSGFADGVQTVCGADLPVSRIDVDGSPRGAFEATVNWLEDNPHVEHVLATSLDDVVAVPMSRAMEQAGRSGVAAGHGAQPNSIERLNEGPPEATRYLGSVAYFPELYGVYAVAALIDILEGRAVPQEIHMDHVWINRDNVEQYYNNSGFPIHNLGP